MNVNISPEKNENSSIGASVSEDMNDMLAGGNLLDNIFADPNQIQR